MKFSTLALATGMATNAFSAVFAVKTTKRNNRRLGKSEQSHSTKDQTMAPRGCAATLPSIVQDLIGLGQEVGLFLAQGPNNNFSDVCCIASGLRAELGIGWAESREGQCPSPWILYPGSSNVPNFFQIPDYLSTPSRRLQGSSAEGLVALNEELKSVIDEGLAKQVLFQIADEFLQPDFGWLRSRASAEPTDAFQDLCDNVALIGDIAGIFGGCDVLGDVVVLVALFLVQPWLMPACHCHYRTTVGCGFSDCFDVNVDSTRLDQPFIPNLTMLSDTLAAAEHNWRAPLTGPDAFGTIRACKAFPGPGTTFTGTFDLLPVRVGGESYEECLGYCYMYGAFPGALAEIACGLLDGP